MKSYHRALIPFALVAMFLTTTPIGPSASAVTTSTANGTTTTYTHDANGNRTSTQLGTTTPQTYTYDQANRLKEAGNTTYSYDGLGLRTKKAKPTGDQDFTYNIAEGLPLVLSDGTHDYLYGPSGEILAQYVGTNVHYLHGDQLGSTRLITDENANLTATYQYDAFGNTTQHSGTTTPFQYAGEYQDEETGFIYLRARYYDSQTAQFLTRDPIEHTTRDPYGYANNDPTNATDPSGFCVGIGCKWGKTWLGKAVVNVASGVLDTHPITATTNALGWSDTGQYANKNSGAFVAGQVAMNAVGPKGMGAGRSAGAATRSVKPPANACLPMRGGASKASDILPTPQVQSQKLQNIVNSLYKGTSNPKRAGDGTTMAAIRHERANETLIHGKNHVLKGQNELNGLNKWLRVNPNADYYDRLVAQSLRDELSVALYGAR